VGVTTDTTGEWTKEILKIDTWRNDIFGSAALALDGAGNGRVAVAEQWTARLFLFGEQPAEWGSTLLDQGSVCGVGSSVAVGSTGVHLAYADWLTETVRYARKDDDGWLRETVGDQGAWQDQRVDHGNTVALDGAGEPHIVYASFDDYNDTWLRYAVRDGGWSSQTVNATAGGWLTRTMIAVDAAGFARIVDNGWQINYSTNESGAWQQEQIISRPTWEGGNDVLAMALDAAGAVHTIFDASSTTFGGLVYANGTFGEWTVEAIADSSYYEQTDFDLALDGNGAVHAVVCGARDSSVSRVAYLTNAGGDWTWETIEEQATAHSSATIVSCAIALDEQGHAFVAYGMDNAYQYVDFHQWYTGKVKYATNLDGQWRTTFIDKADAVGDYLDIALDDQETVHVAYSGENAVWHTYFPIDYGQ